MGVEMERMFDAFKKKRKDSIPGIKSFFDTKSFESYIVTHQDNLTPSIEAWRNQISNLKINDMQDILTLSHAINLLFAYNGKTSAKEVNDALIPAIQAKLDSMQESQTFSNSATLKSDRELFQKVLNNHAKHSDQNPPGQHMPTV